MSDNDGGNGIRDVALYAAASALVLIAAMFASYALSRPPSAELAQALFRSHEMAQAAAAASPARSFPRAGT